MTVDQYADAVTYARLTLATMLALIPGGLTALLRYESLLFVRPSIDADG